MLRPWVLRIQLRASTQTPLYVQIAHALIEEIRRGRLAPRTALPGSRTLGEQLGVSRKTVIAAYDELIAQGWVTSDSTRGTFVSPDLPIMQRWTATKRTVEPAHDDAAGAPHNDSGALPWIERSENYLLFDDGTPDPRLAPVEEISRAYRRALIWTARRGNLGYGDPRGLFALRQAVSTMLNSERGLATTANNICITRGSQMAIFLSTALLIRPGDMIAVETLTYPPAVATFQRAGGRIIPVAVDGDGIVVDDLERACEDLPIKAVYLTPHHHFPTTVSLKPERRLRLIELSKRKGIHLLEDDYDHEFHFDHQPLLPLASATLDRTIYIGSLSKLISPSLRIGYLVSNPELVNRAANEAMLVDRQGSQPIEAAVAELMSDSIRSYARKVHAIYKERRDFFAASLRATFGDEIVFDVPAGGLAFWIRFRPSVNIDRLLDAARAENLRMLPSRIFNIDDKDPEGLRLGFANLDNLELAEGVARLHRAYSEVRNHSHAAQGQARH